MRELTTLPIFETARFSEKLLRVIFKADDTEYVLDYSGYSCSCPEWHGSRSGFEIHDVRRLCKHLARRLPKRLFEEFDGLVRIFVGSFLIDGVPIWTRLAGYKVEDRFVILVEKPDWQWIDVIAVPRKERKNNPYDVFGFNLERKNWSYGTGPKNARTIRELIETWK